MRKRREALRRLLALAAEGQWRALGDKLGRRLRPPPTRRIDAGDFCARLAARRDNPVVLYLAASLGGGAHDALRRQLETQDAGADAVLLSLDGISGSIVASFIDGEAATRARLTGDLAAALPAAAPALASIHCNSLVGFPAPRELFNALEVLAREHAIPLTLEWHDHYLSCPIHTLLDAQGRYCDLPDAATCNRCLFAQRDRLPSAVAEQGIGNWRAATTSLIEASTRVVAFSRSSSDIIARSLGVGDERVVLEPHAMDYFPTTPARQAGSAALHVGVLGRIGMHKGAREIAALAQEMATQGRGERLTVIGTCDIALPGAGARTTGAYRVEDLPARVAVEGVNVILVPSICPETFSFVVHEAMAMELPLLTYALGAQGEAAEAYARGRAIPLGSAAATLTALRELYHDTYSPVDSANG